VLIVLILPTCRKFTAEFSKGGAQQQRLVKAAICYTIPFRSLNFTLHISREISDKKHVF
jgi:hypothetical protein